MMRYGRNVARRMTELNEIRHHAQKTHASGFCYVADCILAILAFKKASIPTLLGPPRKSRTMYLDLDLHFSDAVTQCFYNASRSRSTPQVLTFSVHYDSPGFFPPSPYSGLPDPLSDDFDPFSLSLPLRQGASASTYARIWPIIEDVKDVFDPDFVIVQCGVDGLAGDPCGVFNWSIDNKDGDMAWCIGRIVNNWNRRTLLLGGGLYLGIKYAGEELTAMHFQAVTIPRTLHELGRISHQFRYAASCFVLSRMCPYYRS